MSEVLRYRPEQVPTELVNAFKRYDSTTSPETTKKLLEEAIRVIYRNHTLFTEVLIQGLSPVLQAKLARIAIPFDTNPGELASLVDQLNPHQTRNCRLPAIRKAVFKERRALATQFLFPAGVELDVNGLEEQVSIVTIYYWRGIIEESRQYIYNRWKEMQNSRWQTNTQLRYLVNPDQRDEITVLDTALIKGLPANSSVTLIAIKSYPEQNIFPSILSLDRDILSFPHWERVRNSPKRFFVSWPINGEHDTNILPASKLEEVSPDNLCIPGGSY